MQQTYTVLTDPALTEKYSELESQIAAYALIGNRGDDKETTDAADKMRESLEKELETLKPGIAAATRVLTVTRLSPKKYARLLVSHPPRPNDELDGRYGFNTDTFDTALMEAAVTEVADGAGEPVTDWSWPVLAESMSFGDWTTIISGVMRLHDSGDEVPFSLSDWNKTHD
ncbi:hypothetical protein ACUH93_00555 [Dermabacteraceae bacterium P7006]